MREEDGTGGNGIRLFEMPEGVTVDDHDSKPAPTLTYEQREAYACKVCGNVPDECGTLDHGRGCYVVSEDGGGSSYVEFDPPSRE